jgi:hypothetical protein
VTLPERRTSLVELTLWTLSDRCCRLELAGVDEMLVPQRLQSLLHAVGGGTVVSTGPSGACSAGA